MKRSSFRNDSASDQDEDDYIDIDDDDDDIDISDSDDGNMDIDDTNEAEIVPNIIVKKEESDEKKMEMHSSEEEEEDDVPLPNFVLPPSEINPENDIFGSDDEKMEHKSSSIPPNKAVVVDHALSTHRTELSSKSSFVLNMMFESTQRQLGARTLDVLKSNRTGQTGDEMCVSTELPQAFISHPMKNLIEKLAETIRTLPRTSTQPVNATGPMRGKVRLTQEDYFDVVPCQDAEFESLLLAQAKPYRSPENALIWCDPPPCLAGEECEGMVQNLRGFSENGVRGCILMGYMSPSEYSKFEKSGIRPTQPRYCLLCLRKAAWDVAINGIGSDIDYLDNQDICLQYFRHKVDKPGGYKREYCIMGTSSTNYNGFPCDQVGFYIPPLFAYLDKNEQRWRISQEKMIFREQKNQ